MLTRKTPTTQPTTMTTFEERLGGAYATADAAISVVETIADELEDAAVEHRAVITEIDEEVERLHALLDDLDALRAEASIAEAKSLATATNIRALCA